MSRVYKLHKKKSSNVRKTRRFKKSLYGKSRNLRKSSQSHINRKIKRSNKKTKRIKKSMSGGGVLDKNILGTVLSFTPFNGIMNVINKVMGNKKSEQEDGNSGNHKNITNYEVLENTIKANNHNITALKQLASSNTVDKMPDYIHHLRVINYE